MQRDPRALLWDVREAGFGFHWENSYFDSC